MNFINSSLLTGVSTLIRLLSNIIITKIIAITMGTSGMVLLGQITNLITFVRALSTGGIQQGTVKLLAEKENVNKQDPINASIYISLFFSVFSGLILVFFRNQIGNYFFSSQDYSYLFFVIAIATFFYAINIIFLSVLNGKRQLKLYVIANIIANILGLIVSLILIHFFKVDGLLIAFSINQSIAIFSTLYLIRNQNWYKLSVLLKKPKKKYFKKLLSFSLMSLISAATVPFAYILIRKLLIKEQGIDQAGFWEALVRISSVFVMIVATAYSTYLLPTFSSLERNDLKKELKRIYKIIILIAIASSFFIFLLKEYIVLLLYSEDFIPMTVFFKYQLLGDTIKIITYVTGFLMIAKSMVKYYIFNELIQFSVYILLSNILIEKMGVEGVTFAYMLTAICCFLYQMLILKKILWVKN